MPDETERSEIFSVDYVAENPGKFHRKVINIEGKISSRVKTKKFKGKKYTVFKMKNSARGAAMLVYLKGFHENLKTGNLLNISGRYYKKRRYIFFKLKNVLKARSFTILG